MRVRILIVIFQESKSVILAGQIMQMVDAWGGWSLFQVLLQTLKRVAIKHGVSIPTVAVRYILDQVFIIFQLPIPLNHQ